MALPPFRRAIEFENVVFTYDDATRGRSCAA